MAAPRLRYKQIRHCSKADEGTYLVTSETLDEGSVTVLGNGTEASVHPTGYFTGSNTSSACNITMEMRVPEPLMS